MVYSELPPPHHYGFLNRITLWGVFSESHRPETKGPQTHEENIEINESTILNSEPLTSLRFLKQGVYLRSIKKLVYSRTVFHE